MGSVLGLFGFLGATFGAAALGARFTAVSVNSFWYWRLRKPAWQPPGRAFGPVWTALYAMMAVSAWLVWREGRAARARAASRQLDDDARDEERERADEASAALVAWGAQLALNVAWTGVFFGARRIGGGVAAILALIAAILAAIGLSARVSKPAAALLLPYLAWTTFATALNVRIWQLNRGRWV